MYPARCLAFWLVNTLYCLNFATDCGNIPGPLGNAYTHTFGKLSDFGNDWDCFLFPIVFTHLCLVCSTK